MKKQSPITNNGRNDKEQNAYFQQPALGKERLFFVSENSLWSVPLRGGEAKRLVSGQGTVSHPLLSPDERLIAYAFNEEGSTETYVMHAKGGSAMRLTFHSAASSPAGWSLDSKHLYIRSTMRSHFYRRIELFKVSVEGGDITRLNLGHGVWIHEHEDGERALIGRHQLDIAWWKRYRGGTVGTIWIGSLSTMDFELLLKHEAGHVLPQFYHDRIYFITDRDGAGNVYSVHLRGDELEQHTYHRDFYARFLSVRHGKIAYQLAGDIYLLDLESQKGEKLDIDIQSPLKPEKSYFIDINKHIEFSSLANSGKQTLFLVRGKHILLPNWSGASRYIGIQQGVRYRYSQFLNHRGDILSVSDESGEEELEIHSSQYHKQRVRMGKVPQGYITHLVASPCGRYAVAGTNRRQLYLIDLENGHWDLIDESTYRRGFGTIQWDPAWSHDNRYIAYCKVEDLKYSLFIYDTKEKEVFRATDSEFDDFSPDFDPSGNYLYFTSLRNIDPYPDYFDINFAYTAPAKPYLLVLNKEKPVPFLVPHEKGEEKKNRKDEKQDIDIRIDKEGIFGRVFEFPGIKPSSFCRVVGLKDKVVLASWPIEGLLDKGMWFEKEEKDTINLQIFDFIENRLDSYIDGIRMFSFSQNREWMIFKKGEEYRVIKAGEKPQETNKEDSSENDAPGKQSGLLDLGKIKVRVDLRREWQQIFQEAWRFQLEHFWNSAMSGVDWESVRDKYRPLLRKINTREELSDLLWEVQGELGTSHAYSIGGDFERSKGYSVGMLGADFSFDKKRKKYRIDKVYQGDSFYKDSASPLSMPGVNVKEGEYLLSINGEEVAEYSHPYTYLVNLVNTEVVLTVSETASLKGAREVTVKTLPSEFPLRYRSWVKQNIGYVSEKTNGRAGYLHIPDMNTKGLVEFDRYFYQFLDKRGLIIDIRYNGGGDVSQTLLQKLYRKLAAFMKSRWEGRLSTIPDYVFRGCMVVIIDEFAGSDGDIFPQTFKNLEMGTVIGKRTWGGVIGININHILVDRGVVTQPEYAVWFREKGYGVENYGVEPDIEVENDPKSIYEGKDNQLDKAIQEINRIMEEKGYYEPDLD